MNHEKDLEQAVPLTVSSASTVRDPKRSSWCAVDTSCIGCGYGHDARRAHRSEVSLTLLSAVLVSPGNEDDADDSLTPFFCTSFP